MNNPRRLKRTQERAFSAHHMLINAAKRSNKTAMKRHQGWFYENLSTMLFSVLAIEALSNSVGERVMDRWQDFESSSPNAKLRILAEHLDIRYQEKEEPWATARWLVKFRNLVVHAKPELIVEEKLLTQEEHDRHQFDIPESKLEKQVSSGNATRALRGAEQIVQLLISKIPPDEALGLSVDGWSGTTKLHEET